MPQFTPGTAISDLELQLLELTVPYDEEVPEVSVRPEVVSFRQGQFAAAVASVLDLAPSEALATAESVPDWFAALGPALGSIGDESVLVMGAAALCEFVSQNVTGPCPPDGSSCSPASSSAQTEIDVHEDRQKTENHPHGDRWGLWVGGGPQDRLCTRDLLRFRVWPLYLAQRPLVLSIGTPTTISLALP